MVFYKCVTDVSVMEFLCHHQVTGNNDLADGLDIITNQTCKFPFLGLSILHIGKLYSARKNNDVNFHRYVNIVSFCHIPYLDFV